MSTAIREARLSKKRNVAPFCGSLSLKPVHKCRIDVRKKELRGDLLSRSRSSELETEFAKGRFIEGSLRSSSVKLVTCAGALGYTLVCFA